MSEHQQDEPLRFHIGQQIVATSNADDEMFLLDSIGTIYDIETDADPDDAFGPVILYARFSWCPEGMAFAVDEVEPYAAPIPSTRRAGAEDDNTMYEIFADKVEADLRAHTEECAS